MNKSEQSKSGRMQAWVERAGKWLHAGGWEHTIKKKKHFHEINNDVHYKEKQAAA